MTKRIQYVKVSEDSTYYYKLLPGEKVGYKVLDNLTWRNSSHTNSNTGGIVYRKDFKVYPQKGCGPLMVFKTEKSARSFAYSRPVIKCIYKPSKIQYVWLKEKERYKTKITGWSFPDGKDVADWVLCLE